MITDTPIQTIRERIDLTRRVLAFTAERKLNYTIERQWGDKSDHDFVSIVLQLAFGSLPEDTELPLVKERALNLYHAHPKKNLTDGEYYEMAAHLSPATPPQESNSSPATLSQEPSKEAPKQFGSTKPFRPLTISPKTREATLKPASPTITPPTSSGPATYAEAAKLPLLSTPSNSPRPESPPPAYKISAHVPKSYLTVQDLYMRYAPIKDAKRHQASPIRPVMTIHDLSKKFAERKSKPTRPAPRQRPAANGIKAIDSRENKAPSRDQTLGSDGRPRQRGQRGGNNGRPNLIGQDRQFRRSWRSRLPTT